MTITGGGITLSTVRRYDDVTTWSVRRTDDGRTATFDAEPLAEVGDLFAMARAELEAREES
jgi:hypothetical protein